MSLHANIYCIFNMNRILADMLGKLSALSCVNGQCIAITTAILRRLLQKKGLYQLYSVCVFRMEA